jgi:hypothetical protein
MWVALSPRARLGVVAVWRLELFVALGLELWLSNTRYGIQTSGSESAVVLHPHRVRAWTSAGVAVRI